MLKSIINYLSDLVEKILGTPNEESCGSVRKKRYQKKTEREKLLYYYSKRISDDDETLKKLHANLEVIMDMGIGPSTSEVKNWIERYPHGLSEYQKIKDTIKKNHRLRGEKFRIEREHREDKIRQLSGASEPTPKKSVKYINPHCDPELYTEIELFFVDYKLWNNEIKSMMNKNTGFEYYDPEHVRTLMDIARNEHVPRSHRPITGNNNSRYISNSVRGEVFLRDSGRCRLCGSTVNVEYDHITPFSKGGGNDENNIQLLCLACNRSKGAK